MASWVRLLLVFGLLVQAQLGTSSACLCRHAGQCGDRECLSGHGSSTAPKKRSCCQKSEPAHQAPKSGPCRCGGCNRSEAGSFLGTQASVAGTDSLWRSGPDVPVALVSAAFDGMPRLEPARTNVHGPPSCPSFDSPDLLPVLRL